jgi:hypothetical protein
MRSQTVQNLIENTSYTFVNDSDPMENLITVVLSEDYKINDRIDRDAIVSKIWSEIVAGEYTFGHGNWCILASCNHSFRLTGEMPCTGSYKCVKCGYEPSHLQRKFIKGL